MQLYKPHDVKNVNCNTCGELLLKFYPWAYSSDINQMKISCGRCYNKEAKKKEKVSFVAPKKVKTYESPKKIKKYLKGKKAP